jgi:hypothetical protein
MLSQKLDESRVKEGHDFARLYNDMLREYNASLKDKSGYQYFSMLWDTVAPKGSIYRRNGLYAEHRKHSEDIWAQMYMLADRHSDVLGGSSLTTEERARKLLEKLECACIEGRVKYDDEEVATDISGFLPLMEWLRVKVFRVGPILLYEDYNDRREEERNICLAICVFSLQVIAPFLIFLNRWNMPTNYVRNWKTMKDHLRVSEIFCPGTSLDDILTTIMGVLLLFVIIFVVRCYIITQIENAKKSSLLPTDSVWMLVGILANAWACTFVCLDIPLLFWSEETPTNIVLDSMTLLFLFKLDDLSDQLCCYLGMTDEDFQRLSGWNAALLSQCPVDLADVINEKAQSSDDLWIFKYDPRGRLLNFKGGRCLTRLGHEEMADERSPIAHAISGTVSSRSSSSLFPDRPVIYRTSPGIAYELPTLGAQILTGAWICLSYVLAVGQAVIPVGWYMINKKCFKGT